ncbi:hypothetical protein GCM10008024_30260 [Allgaiera indica]|uniref:Uncharacterized protein n=1 Tax=Allgaiera indica TaxID=765699 RepID=A0AAN5A0G7_9RHOB|nr:hypothetical protein GCM10008024_30260 [Allgaiera indica]
MNVERRRRSATTAEIERAIRVAIHMGLTIHGFKVRGNEIEVFTSSEKSSIKSEANEVQKWFAQNG